MTLEETKSDVLILLDCCHAGGSSGDANKGTKEVIAACGFESWAPGVGDHSFTKSLIEEFEYLSTGPAFSASILHSRVLDRIKYWNPVYNAKEREVEGTDGRFRDKERRKCPVHISLNKDTMRKSIEIVSRKVSPRKLAFSKASRYADPVEGDGYDHHTEVTLAIQVESDQTLHPQDLIAWIREIPLLAKSVKLQAVQKSYSTLLLISLPVAVWNLLPDDPACSFVGFTTSSNLLLGNSQNRDNELDDKSHASTELGPQVYETRTTPFCKKDMLQLFESQSHITTLLIAKTCYPSQVILCLLKDQKKLVRIISIAICQLFPVVLFFLSLSPSYDLS